MRPEPVAGSNSVRRKFRTSASHLLAVSGLLLSTSLFFIGVGLFVTTYAKWFTHPIIQSSSKEQWVCFWRGRVSVLSLECGETADCLLNDDACKLIRARFPQIIYGANPRKFLGFEAHSTIMAERSGTHFRSDRIGLPSDASDFEIPQESSVDGGPAIFHSVLLTYYRYDFPFWPLLLGGVPMFLIVVRRLKTYRRTRLGLCESCGYDLRGSSGPNCPECGELMRAGRDVRVG